MDERLQRAQLELQRRACDIGGTVGVAAWPVGKPDQAIGINADELFPTASTFKVPLLYALGQMVDRCEIQLDQRVRIETEDRVPGSGVLQFLDPGLEPTVHDLAVLMTIVSDNEATDTLYNLVGTERIHAALDTLGLSRIRVPLTCRALLYDYVGLDPTNPEHTYDLSLERMRNGEYNYDGCAWSDVEGSGNNLASPRDLAMLCELIEQGVGLSESIRQTLLEIMKSQTINDRIPAGVPENTPIAHKTGSLRGVRNDVGIVYAPNGSYVVALFSKRLADERAGINGLADLSKIVWETFGAHA